MAPRLPPWQQQQQQPAFGYAGAGQMPSARHRTSLFQKPSSVRRL
jgi:hypothetical protein